MFKDIQAIITAHRVNGGVFFEPRNMKKWHGKVYNDIYGGELFITSERRTGEARNYTVRKLSDDRHYVTNVSDFEQFNTLRQARAYAREQVE